MQCLAHSRHLVNGCFYYHIKATKPRESWMVHTMGASSLGQWLCGCPVIAQPHSTIHIWLVVYLLQLTLNWMRMGVCMLCHHFISMPSNTQWGFVKWIISWINEKIESKDLPHWDVWCFKQLALVPGDSAGEWKACWSSVSGPTLMLISRFSQQCLLYSGSKSPLLQPQLPHTSSRNNGCPKFLTGSLWGLSKVMNTKSSL